MATRRALSAWEFGNPSRRSRREPEIELTARGANYYLNPEYDRERQKEMSDANFREEYARIVTAVLFLLALILFGLAGGPAKEWFPA